MNKRPKITCSLIVLFAFLGGCAGPAAQHELRVLSYNIHHGQGTDDRFDLPRLARVINELKPDLVALQEVDRKTHRASGIDQAAELASLTGMYHAYGPAMTYDGGEYGEAILSRWPIIEIVNHVMPKEQGSEPRALLMVLVEPPGFGPVRFAGTHLAHDSASDRLSQTQAMNAITSEAGKVPMILAGDLNAEPDSPPMLELFSQWADAAVGLASTVPTFPNVNPQKRIDYILYRPERAFTPVDFRVIEGEIASDHCPILAVFLSR